MIAWAVSRMSAHGFAGTVQNLHAGFRDADLLLLGVGLDVMPAPAQVGVVAKAEDF